MRAIYAAASSSGSFSFCGYTDGKIICLVRCAAVEIILFLVAADVPVNIHASSGSSEGAGDHASQSFWSVLIRSMTDISLNSGKGRCRISSPVCKSLWSIFSNAFISALGWYGEREFLIFPSLLYESEMRDM